MFLPFNAFSGRILLKLWQEDKIIENMHMLLVLCHILSFGDAQHPNI